MVPHKFYNKDKSVQLIMIEVRRDLYMDEQTGKKIKILMKLDVFCKIS